MIGFGKSICSQDIDCMIKEFAFHAKVLRIIADSIDPLINYAFVLLIYLIKEAHVQFEIFLLSLSIHFHIELAIVEQKSRDKEYKRLVRV